MSELEPVSEEPGTGVQPLSPPSSLPGRVALGLGLAAALAWVTLASAVVGIIVGGVGVFTGWAARASARRRGSRDAVATFGLVLSGLGLLACAAVVGRFVLELTLELENL